MVFNSLTFIIFFIVVLFLYYVFPNKYKWILLLISSYIFYMSWRIEFIFLILFSCFFNHLIGLRIYNSKDSLKRKKFLYLGLIINFSILFLFKYLVFINNSFIQLYDFLGLKYPIKSFDIILPLGISFYTFQAVSYIIDIYKKRYPAERNVFKLSLYITFFPQLVAGPIERADRLLEQLFKEKKFNIDNISLGLKIAIIGYFKKVVIADRVAILVNGVFNSPKDYDGIALIIATLFFAIQIYCDFSGYSDIAIGLSKMFGIDLINNFKRPYFSKNIKEFWSRWHISLSNWFKDYLYIPLGGNKQGFTKTQINLLITFMVSGIWHGANWTFILWGFIHGIYQVISNLKNKYIKQKNSTFFTDILRIIFTFSLVCFAWIFFRANTISDGIYIATHLFKGISNIFSLQYLYNIITGFKLNIFEIFVCIFSIFLLFTIECFEVKNSIHNIMKRSHFIFRFLFYFIIVISILSLGVFDNVGEFIYFQF